MNRIANHIANVPLLSLLIVIGLGMAQLHDAVHTAESVHTQSEQPQGQLSRLASMMMNA